MMEYASCKFPQPPLLCPNIVFRTLFSDTLICVRFEVLKAARMMMIFWVLVPCRLVGRCHRFGDTYCLYFSPEDGDSMFFRWHLPTSQHGVKTQNIITIALNYVLLNYSSSIFNRNRLGNNFFYSLRLNNEAVNNRVR
jgi:hypothetical protein